jgi:hypothetical protein
MEINNFKFAWLVARKVIFKMINSDCVNNAIKTVFSVNIFRIIASNVPILATSLTELAF